MGAEVIGIPYYGAAYPIFIDEKIIGGISIAVPIEHLHINQELQNTSLELATAMEQIAATIENIAASAQVLATAGDYISQSSINVKSKAEETDKVIRYINSVATDTQLLGLNASIEAARAGNAGRRLQQLAKKL